MNWRTELKNFFVIGKKSLRPLTLLFMLVLLSIVVATRACFSDEPVLETLPVERLNEATMLDGNKTWKEVFELQQQELDQGNIECVMLGDSITFRFRTTGKTVWDTYLGPRNVVNLGIDSDRTEHVIWRLLHYDWSKASPKLAFVLIGSNNYRDSTAANIVAGNRRICEILRELFPDIKIVVFELFPFRLINGEESERQLHLRNEVNRLLRQEFAACDSVQVVNVESLFLSPDGTVAAETMPDGVHLCPSAFDRWAQEITCLIDANERSGE
ncbi:MAG: GDSL-type esterase/lipase family protein [Planctomycetia bacterium]|nr:GDSL-type esterase/lipase family protein [Planctomycetia bacterium]